MRRITLVVAGLLLTAAESSAALIADYQFHGNLDSSVAGAPTLGDPSGGTNTFTNVSVFGQPTDVYNFAVGTGVVLDTTTLLSGGHPSVNGVYTIVELFSFADVSSANGYKKINDFKHRTTDNGLYSHFGSADFFSGATAPGATIAADTFVQVVLTRDGSNLTGYVDGVQQFSFADSGQGVIDGNNLLTFFRDDTIQNSEHSAGSVARIQLYDTVLNAAEVAALQPVPEPAGLLAAAAAGAAAFALLRRHRRVA